MSNLFNNVLEILMLHNVSYVQISTTIMVSASQSLADVISKKHISVDLCTHYLLVFLKWNMTYLSTLI